jgi:transmembrane sensor
MKTADDIDREAATWIAREDAASATDGAKAALDAWLSADVRHRAAYLRMKNAWGRSLMAERLRPLNGPIDRDLLAPPRAAPRSRAPRWVALAAAIAVVCVGLGVAVWAMRSGEKVYATGPASLERIQLEDGSSVDLNTESEIAVRMSDERRLIVLRKGEAHFRVAREAGRPFEVQGGGSTVRAVGTAFLVRLRDGAHAEVLVTEGRVIVAPSGAGPRKGGAVAPMVVAGEVATVRRDRVTLTRVPSSALTSRLAWTEGKIVLDEEPLARAVEQFNRYNSVKMVVGDPSLEAIRVGGTFEARDLQSFLAALHRVFDIAPRDSGSGTVTLVRESGPGSVEHPGLVERQER